jgi:membrane-associated protein
MPLEMIEMLKSIGYLGMMLSVLLENGVVFLFFMPSDSLLFTAGFLCSQGYFDLYITIFVLFIGSVLGYQVGYSIGYKAGPMLFKDTGKGMMTQEHLDKAKMFYNKYASWALVLARFFPVRALVSSMAGATRMDYKEFMFYNVLGGAIWSVSLTLAGYYVGEFFAPKDLHHVFVFMIVAFVLIVAVIPVGMHYMQKKMRAKRAQGEKSE